MRFGWAGLLLAGTLLAHDLSVGQRTEGAAVVLSALYGGSEPAAFCQVSVRAPSKPEAEFQTGRTDARGRFAFVPDGPGDWKVVVDDEMGHRVELQVRWSGSGGGVPDAAGQPLWQKALTGASLLLGVTGLWLWWRVRGQL